jgi:hypothetical protein
MLRRIIPTLILFLLLPAAVSAQQEPLPSIADKTEGMQQLDGFMPLYWDERSGKLFLEIGRFDEDVLYYTSLPAGIGDNDLGLNRGDLGGTHVVQFQRVGPKVLMIERNLRFRAVSDDAMERKAVEDAFARSALWGWSAQGRARPRRCE